MTYGVEEIRAPSPSMVEALALGQEAVLAPPSCAGQAGEPLGPLRVLVCGGRNYGNARHLFSVLDDLHWTHQIVLVINGGSRGADSLATEWAQSHAVECTEYRPQWDTYGLRAGPVRNRLMLERGKPDLVLAFPGGKGTADMIRQATEAGVPVRREII